MDGFLFEFVRQDLLGRPATRQAIAIAATEAAAHALLGPFDAVLVEQSADVLERGRALGVGDDECLILPRA